MKEELIKSKTAELAKKVNVNLSIFDEGYTYIDNDGNEMWTNTEEGISGNENTSTNILLTQSLLQKYLRQKHNIFIEVGLTDNSKSYHFDCVIITSNDRDYNDEDCMDSAKRDYINGEFKTFEEALEEGLYQSLLLIKNK